MANVLSLLRSDRTQVRIGGARVTQRCNARVLLHAPRIVRVYPYSTFELSFCSLSSGTMLPPMASTTLPLSLQVSSARAPIAIPSVYPTVTLAITEAFVAPSYCTDLITMLGSSLGYSIFYNEPSPAPSMTFSACHPPPFVSSYLDYLSGTISLAFSPLVCPRSYYTVRSIATEHDQFYIACCPT
jgi:hypothetical protein